LVVVNGFHNVLSAGHVKFGVESGYFFVESENAVFEVFFLFFAEWTLQFWDFFAVVLGVSEEHSNGSFEFAKWALGIRVVAVRHDPESFFEGLDFKRDF